MRALILAAGRGRRIESLAGDSPKAFLELGGRRILDHQIDAFRSVGVEEFVLVVGHRSELFRKDYAGTEFVLIQNPFFSRTNVLASVWFAREVLREGCFFVHADTYFEPSIVQDLHQAGTSRGIHLAVQRKDTAEEEMKVQVEENRVVQISKEMSPELAYGEFIGLASIGKEAGVRLAEHVEQLIEQDERLDDFFEAAIQCSIDEGTAVSILDIGQRMAIEIDFPEDYRLATRLFDSRQG